MHFKHICLTTAMAAIFSISAHAATGTTTATPVVTTTTASTPTTSGNGNQGAQLVLEYTTLAGSTANAQSLVTGLRTGAPITLQTAPGSAANSVTFSTQTQTMGWGSVSKALSLAQADLASMGITNPTPQQLQTTLMGGTITTAPGTTTQVNGILTMRSQGMGWGQIAHKLNLQPGASFKSGRMENRLQDADASHEHHHEDISHAESESHTEHHAMTASGNTVNGAGRVTTAGGKLAHELHHHDSHETGQTSLHLTHAPISRVVTASGAPISSGTAFNHSEHNSNQVEINQTSHITTAAGGGMITAGGHEGGHGGGLSHGKD